MAIQPKNSFRKEGLQSEGQRADDALDPLQVRLDPCDHIRPHAAPTRPEPVARDGNLVLSDPERPARVARAYARLLLPLIDAKLRVRPESVAPLGPLHHLAARTGGHHRDGRPPESSPPLVRRVHGTEAKHCDRHAREWPPSLSAQLRDECAARSGCVHLHEGDIVFDAEFHVLEARVQEHRHNLTCATDSVDYATHPRLAVGGEKHPARGYERAGAEAPALNADDEAGPYPLHVERVGEAGRGVKGVGHGSRRGKSAESEQAGPEEENKSPHHVEGVDPEKLPRSRGREGE